MKGVGETRVGQRDPDHPPSRTSRSPSLSLPRLSLSLSPATTTWRCCRPARVTGERRGRAVPSPRVLNRFLLHPNSPTSHKPSPTRSLRLKPADTCRKSATHHRPDLPYKLGAKTEPQLAKNVTEPRARGSGLLTNGLGFGVCWEGRPTTAIFGTI